MREYDPLDLESIDRRIRESLSEPTDTANTDLPKVWESDVVPGPAAPHGMPAVLAWQGLADTTTFRQLERLGYSPPHPNELTEHTLPVELDLLLRKLSELRVFLTKTNHLSDRELYELLWHTTLRETVKDLPIEAGYFHHIDLLGDCTEENIAIFYKYYANDAERLRWHKQFPEFNMPAHVDPPNDRDRMLPKR